MDRNLYALYEGKIKKEISRAWSHIEKNHINLTLDELETRLTKLKDKKNSKSEAVSTFTGRKKLIKKFIREALMDEENFQKIKKWYEEDCFDIRIIFELDDEVGGFVYDGSLHQADYAVIVIERDRHYNDFIIKTAYVDIPKSAN